MNLVK